MPMRIFLAPMEGVLDHHLRQILTALGGYHACVTEFVRVVEQVLPKRVFYKRCPELRQAGKTAAGTPVLVQLLGSDPQAMADNALQAIKLGAPGIDINFGCPSKCVNRRDGGAVLLREPDRIYTIVKAVQDAVAGVVPVSAKIRLGYDTTDLALDNALAVQAAGASFITVHARTKLDGYRAPARWEWLGMIREAVTIPVVANGDINSVEDYARCIEMSGCKDIMLGRGAVARPDLAYQIMRYHQDLVCRDLSWIEVKKLIMQLAVAMQPTTEPKYVVPRIKQWAVMLRNEYTEAETFFQSIRQLRHLSELESVWAEAGE